MPAENPFGEDVGREPDATGGGGPCRECPVGGAEGGCGGSELGGYGPG